MADVGGDLERPTPQQRLAVDPTRSVWVTANAGTGKTRVLTNRVLRLLLDGADPEAILCITFTKAAAAEMASRIEKELAGWAIEADPAALEETLERLIGEPPRSAVVERARRLFAQVLDLPNGLAVMTIHGFCQGLLRRFPLEAGIAPHFELIDERSAREMQLEVLRSVLASRNETIRACIGELAVLLGDESLSQAMAQLLGRRQQLSALAAQFGDDKGDGGDEGVIAAVHRRLDVEPGDTAHSIRERACRAFEVDSRNLVPAAEALIAGTAAQRANGEMILAWLNAGAADRLLLFESYRAVLLTQAGEPAKRLVPKAMPQPLADALIREQARLVHVEHAIKALEVARRTAIMLRVGLGVIQAYGEAKQQKAALDFDDLIAKTEQLLRDPEKCQWVRFKLDAGIDHLLVDEAQDTSPAQWAIIEHLVDEFSAGEGAVRRPRTLFVVGDEKQSIYSFQGADLASFAAVRERLTARFDAARRPLEPAVLDLSFRSGPAILEVVDRVLAEPVIRAAVAGDPLAGVRHQTFRRHARSCVELWPLIEPVEKPSRQDEGWLLPTERHDTEQPEARLALAIAQTIKGWLDSGAVLEATGTPIRPGDILILLQRRGIAQERILKALKEAGIPVAGADRLKLTDAIAVEDLVALGQAVLLPEDDLTLAALLKSPLLGLDEDGLFRLGHGRLVQGRLGHGRGEGVSLFQRLRELGQAGEAPFAALWQRFEDWRRWADFMPPFELFARILGPEGGRRRLLQRLGPDAAEPIEAFLAQALAYEEGHPASLEGFIHWLLLDEGSLKRDLEQASDAVRVMTVHGSKGLEAPIVFLAEAGPYEPQDSRDRLMFDPLTGLPIWRTGKTDRDPVSESIAQSIAEQQAAERWRLAYVAMTRARDRLYVAGWAKRRAGGSDSWHDVIGRALDSLDGVEPGEVDGSRRLVMGVAGSEPELRPVVPEPVPAAPAWLEAPPAPEPPRRRLVQPSEEEVLALPAASPLAGRPSEARLFGTALHRLLHELAALPENAREPALGVRLESWPGLDVAARHELARQVMGVLGLADLAPAFGPGGRSEQPIVGRIGEVVVAGQIDRFAVTDDALYLVDFKSNRLPPASPDAVPAAYLRQLAAYAALLSTLYPGRAVRAGLVWTVVPALMPIPEALLLAHRRHAGLAA